MRLSRDEARVEGPGEERRRRLSVAAAEHLGDAYSVGKISAKCCSFSAVSAPIFASKYALESSRRDLHDALLCTVLKA